MSKLSPAETKIRDNAINNLAGILRYITDQACADLLEAVGQFTAYLYATTAAEVCGHPLAKEAVDSTIVAFEDWIEGIAKADWTVRDKGTEAVKRFVNAQYWALIQQWR